MFQSRRALCLNAWPKETKSGSMSWCWLCWRRCFFPKGCGFQSSNALVWVPCLRKKKNKEKGQILPLFSVRIYLLLFIMTLLLKLFFLWDQILGGGKSSQSTSRLNLTSSCFALKILAQHLHIPKRLLFLKMGCVSSFWRFFLKCILCTFNPIRYCNNTGTFHPLGLREGNRAKK